MKAETRTPQKDEGKNEEKTKDNAKIAPHEFIMWRFLRTV